jgi:hypothetical protein
MRSEISSAFFRMARMLPVSARARNASICSGPGIPDGSIASLAGAVSWFTTSRIQVKWRSRAAGQARSKKAYGSVEDDRARKHGHVQQEVDRRDLPE